MPLPNDWSVVAADIRGSTRAIAEGRYQDVNTVGVSVIAALRNVAQSVEASDALATYRWVMERTRQIYGDADQCRPVVEEGLQLTMSGRALSRETRPKLGRRGPRARILAAVTLHATVLGARILFRVGPRVGATDWGSYKRDVVVDAAGGGYAAAAVNLKRGTDRVAS